MLPTCKGEARRRVSKCLTRSHHLPCSTPGLPRRGKKKKMKAGVLVWGNYNLWEQHKTNNAGKDIVGTQLCGTEEGQLGLAKLGAAVDSRSGEGHLHKVGHTDPYSESPLKASHTQKQMTSWSFPRPGHVLRNRRSSTGVSGGIFQLHLSSRERTLWATTKLLHKFVNPRLILTLLQLW